MDTIIQIVVIVWENIVNMESKKDLTQIWLNSGRSIMHNALYKVRFNGPYTLLALVRN